MGCVAVLGEAPGLGFQRRRQRSAFQSLNRSWVGAVIKEVGEWSFHPTSIPGWRRPRLCRVLSPEEAENTGRGEFTRHSPELGIVTKSVWVSLLHAGSAAMVSKQRTQTGRCHPGAASGAFERDKQSVRRSLRPFEPQIVVKKFRCLRGQRQDIGLFSHAARPALPFP